MTNTGARAAILAGGRGSRLGGGKATAELAGRPLISYPIDAARGAGLAPMVVAKRGSELPALDCELVTEPDEPVHPLLGIVTALGATGGPVLVLGCDMPFVTAPLLEWLSGREPPTVAAMFGHLEPLLGIYGKADAPSLRAALEQAAPLRRAVERLRPTRVGEAELSRFGDPSAVVRSINTEEDLAAAESALSL
jgi:molybdopterin-guanine dinucleotide biosynthesis protein A